MEIILSAVLILASYNIQGAVALDSNIALDSPAVVQLLKGANIPVDCAYANLPGDFTFQDVPAGSYYIRVQHEGFEDGFERVEVPVAESPLIVLHRPKANAGDGVPHLGGAYQVNVRQLATPPEAVQHYAQALADLKAGRIDRSISHLQAAIDIAGDFVEAVYQLTDLFYEQGHYSDSEQLLMKTTAIVPTDIHLHTLLARVFVREHKYKEALAELDYVENNAAEPERAKLDRFRARLSRRASENPN